LANHNRRHFFSFGFSSFVTHEFGQQRGVLSSINSTHGVTTLSNYQPQHIITPFGMLINTENNTNNPPKRQLAVPSNSPTIWIPAKST
jgi:hypothetical protein